MGPRAIRRKARELVEIVRYARWAGRMRRAGRLIDIPMQLATDEHAFSLASDGWNFYRALAAEYARNPEITLDQTVFYRFFRHERVRSVGCLDDLLFLHEPDRARSEDEPRFALGTYPWGGWSRAAQLAGGAPFGREYDQAEGTNTRDPFGDGPHPWYDPGEMDQLEHEWRLTRRLYHALEKGYHPLRHRGYPGVTLLVRRNGERRAVMGNGHHRMAILSHLGHASLRVMLPLDWSGVVAEGEVHDWFHVRLGHCSRERALEIFNAFFECNGRERIEHLGLPTVY